MVERQFNKKILAIQTDGGRVPKVNTNCFFIGLANKKNAIFAKDLINDCKGGVTEPAMPPSRGGLDGVARHFIWG